MMGIGMMLRVRPGVELATLGSAPSCRLWSTAGLLPGAGVSIGWVMGSSSLKRTVLWVMTMLDCASARSKLSAQIGCDH